MKERYHLNAPGDFYVVQDECIICCAPEHAAPDLMGFFVDPDGSHRRSHCYFKRQPTTNDERRQAIDAIRASCCCALRYAGSDPAVLAALIKAGHREVCDNPEPGASPV
jgi:hypothetical protein